jgi:hypothetical protein
MNTVNASSGTKCRHKNATAQKQYAVLKAQVAKSDHFTASKRAECNPPEPIRALTRTEDKEWLRNEDESAERHPKHWRSPTLSTVLGSTHSNEIPVDLAIGRDNMQCQVCVGSIRVEEG